MRPDKTNNKMEDAGTLALLALGWLLESEDRAARLLALTGLDAPALRARLNDPALLDAVLGFLENHEPDLVACAAAIGCAPSAIVAAREAFAA